MHAFKNLFVSDLSLQRWRCSRGSCVQDWHACFQGMTGRWPQVRKGGAAAADGSGAEGGRDVPRRGARHPKSHLRGKIIALILPKWAASQQDQYIHVISTEKSEFALKSVCLLSWKAFPLSQPFQTPPFPSHSGYRRFRLHACCTS